MGWGGSLIHVTHRQKEVEEGKEPWRGLVKLWPKKDEKRCGSGRFLGSKTEKRLGRRLDVGVYGECLGDLLNLFRCLGTSGNPICFGSLACTQTKKRDTSGCRVQIKDRKERNNETYVVQEGWSGLGLEMKQHNRAREGGQGPFRAEVPARPKKTCTKCSPGDLAWQRKREDSDKKCIVGGSGGRGGHLSLVERRKEVFCGRQTRERSA